MRHPLLTLAVLCGLLAPLGLQAPTAFAANGAASAPSADSAAQNARVIVKFKADSTVMRKQALSVNGSAATPAQAAALGTARATVLGSRVGLALTAGASVAERTQVVFAQGISSQELVDKLAQNSDVEYAVIDQRRHAYAVPNDSYYLNGPATRTGSGGPAVGQWYLRAPDATVKASIDAESAWAETTGSASIVVAVLDTGLRFDHADLQGGNVLPGYDMIHDAFTANDGGGRDADASDPGDAVTAADVSSSSNNGGCTTSDITNASSWHGTQTLGLIGATTNNGIGIASVGRNVRVMPVRVLGKCGGFDSDIIAGMRWAAGLSVGDTYGSVPLNATPARVINMSLGGPGSCSSAYTDAIAAVNAVGAVVVASAGNSEGHAVSTPANCAGVIAVAGLRHVGTKVGFSDLGPQIAISAPAGNCVNTASGSACLYPIMTLANSGAVTPVSNAAGGSIYTDSFDTSLGTSFSAPLVSGTVALMLSLQPTLSPAQVKNTLQSTARVFPTSGGDNGDGTLVATCTAPQYTSAGVAINQDQCYCTTGTCGAGMLDAGAALRSLVVTGTARITSVPAVAAAGQLLTLSSANSRAATGRSIASVKWRLIDGGGVATADAFNSAGSMIALTPTGPGSITVGLTVTDSNGSSVDTTSVINVVPVGSARITQVPADLAVVGQLLTLSAASSVAPIGRTIDAYKWRVIDGAGNGINLTPTGTLGSVSFTPIGAGTITLGVTLTDNSGATTDTVFPINVVAAGVTKISQSPSAPVSGQVLTLDGTGSTAPVGRSIASYQWSLINGAGVVAAFNSSAAAPTVTLIPSAAGRISVQLTVTDSAGSSVITQTAIDITAAPVPAATRISQSPATAVAGQPLTLDGSTSTAASGSSVASYQWRLIDGGGVATGFTTSTTASSVTLTPSAAGTVTVGLTVTDSTGTAVDGSRVIAVSAAPVVVTTTTSTGSTSSGGGGGALGLQWLALLALACVAAGRSRSPR